jgi:hypothetical protein
VYHGTDLVLPGQKLTDYQVTWDLRRNIKASGSGTMVYESVNGESALPSGVNGFLSPFRAKLLLSMTVHVGAYVRRVQLGWFRLMRTPTGTDQTADVNGATRVITSTVSLVFESLDTDVYWGGFHQEEQPPSTGSAFAELRRIGILPVRDVGDDYELPAGLTWAAKEGGRLDAVHAIAAADSRIPVVDSQGMWALIPDDPTGDPVMQLRVGEFGTVVDYEQSVDTDGIFNEVVGEFEAEDGSEIRAVRSLTAGALSVSGVWMRKTAYFSSPVIRSQAAADAAVITRLANVSGSQVYDVPVTCILNPVVEVGDLVALVDDTETVLLSGQVVQQQVTDSELMGLVVRVRRRL